MASLSNPRAPPETPRSERFNPLALPHHTKDYRWINLWLPMPKRWPDPAKHIDRGDLT